ncbi:MAG TPA: enoyl-CoA hydratase/isomerase family protein [Bacteroidales bacterium]|nr:enoyl-CoA hydratase/isomerase family protein [Bacteroidales bacterium]
MTLDWTLENGIGLITLDRPPSNTMTLGFFNEFRDLVATIGRERGLKAVIIRGRGRHFSSGADVQELLDCTEPGLMMENYRTFQLLEEMPVPVIAAIRGVCLGSAFELALFCHFRICSHDAVLGLPETNFNLMPGIGGIQRMAALAAEARAVELVLRGNTFQAAEAFTYGLADYLVPKQQVLDSAMSLAAWLPGTYQRENRKLYIQQYLRKHHDGIQR